MRNFYKIAKENLHYNRFEFRETVCLEYTCPIDAEQIGIFSRNDYLVYVLSGKKTYRTVNGEWTLTEGQALYLKKGAEIVHQFFDDEFCMLGFFLSDELIRETYQEVKGKIAVPFARDPEPLKFTATEVQPSNYLEGFFHSMLAYFRGIDRPPDHMLALKLKELLVTLMTADPMLAAYFNTLSETGRVSLSEIMEKNFCYNLKIEDYAELTHRSLSTFKRDFQQHYNESPGRWLLKRRIHHAAHLIAHTGTPLSQIAFDCGFEDLSHFSRAFKKIMGHSPSDYKKSLAAALETV
ncbi:MAG: AraC family transcriptional regulator [Lewinellaceae bacterium]|nr:AraC family transcriptional regulator [Saprospiraceae bacterium]MCB9356467.1 AraC family transcriptional regulator [Lewinellaceae bacterium]